jgi:hypothetical protein
MIHYERELLQRGEAFRDKFAKANPNHPELRFIDADLVARKAMVGQLEIVPATIQTPQATERQSPRVDLRSQTYELLSQVREPSSEEKEALQKIGIKFFHVASKSYAQVVAENPAYFWDKELEYANARPELKDYALPMAVEVGLRRPSELALLGSFGKSRETQLEMINAYSQELQLQFPNIRAIMLPSTGYAQADEAYKAETGEVLFRNYFARALDNLSGVDSAHAGRDDPSYRFFVGGWDRGSGLGSVGAVPAVVFVGNK